MSEFTDFAKSIAGILTAFATLLGALSAFFPKATAKIVQRASRSRRPEEVKKNQPESSQNGSPRYHNLLGSLLLLTSVTLITANLIPDKRPLNEILMHRTWSSFKPAYDAWIDKDVVKEKQLRMAIRYSERSDSLFGQLAESKQDALLQARVPPPPINPESEAEKKLLLERGLLNDVATSRWILGRSYEILGETELANKWYQKTTNLTFARTLNANGQGFWSPSEDAAARLSEMRKGKKTQ